MQALHDSNGRHLARFNLGNYVDGRDAAEAYRLAVEAPLQGHAAMFVVADDSSFGEPLSDVMPRFIPSLREMASVLTGTRPGLTNARAKKLLGWQPTRTWRRPETFR
jgi:nucleoside-diphosphate-sugar epimerase